MITIGLFNDSFYPFTDGVVMVVDNYARRLAKYANVVVFVPDYNKKFDDSTLPYKVVRCRSFKVPFLDYSLAIPFLDKKFKKQLKQYHLDIVHIHSPFTIGKVGIKYAKKNNIPLIATMHSQFKRDVKRAIKCEYLATKINNRIIKSFDKCDECWAVNSEVARIYYEEYKCHKYPSVMNNATEMLPIEENNFINQKYNIKDEKVFLFVGRINILKNILFIVDSLKIIKTKKPKLKFKMLFVGTGQDEELLKQHIKELNLENDIILCGKVTDRYELACYYKRADLFLFPSVYDCSSIVQIEASSQQTPTLFLENTATSSTVTNNVNGFISPNSPLKYAERIIEIIENKKLYQEVSKNAYNDLYKTWDETVKIVYEKYLEKIH